MNQEGQTNSIFRCSKAISLFYSGMILSLGFYSCSDKHREPVPDVSKIPVEFKVVRFEQEIAKLDTTRLESALNDLLKRYPAFAKLYFEHILSITVNADSIQPGFVQSINQFLRDSETVELNKMVQSEFGDERILSKDLKRSLQFMKYYFPNEKEPVFYTLISNFSYGNFIFQDSKDRDGIGIGLDFFLGQAFDYKKIDPKNPAFSNYLNRCFNKDHLLKKTWEAWLEDRLGTPENGRFLDYLMLRGKKLYTLTKILPEIPDTVLFEYTPTQLEWCNHNRVEMWAHFLNSNLLYSTEMMKFNKLVNPSPNSPGMPEQAPGQTGSYMGYEIIRSYMKRNPQKTLLDLWKITDNQTLLNDSKFKPRNE
jgi:hypothetical protein